MDCSDGGCLTAVVMFGVEGVWLLAAGDADGELHLLVETIEGSRGADPAALSRPRTGDVEHLLREAPFGHRRVR